MSDQITPDEEAEIHEERERLHETLRGLDPQKLCLLRMRFKDEMTWEEIGRVYGRSRTKIAGDVKKVLEEIRERMK